VKRVALAAVISLATLTVAALLWRFRAAALLLALSVVVAAAARPSIDALERRLGRSLAVGVSYGLGLALFGIFLYLVSRGVLRELDSAADRLSAAYDHLRAQAAASRAFPSLLIGHLPPAASLYHAIGGARPTQLLDQALGVTRNTIGVATSVLVVIALSAYWSASREPFERLWLSLVPAPQRPRARGVWRTVERAVGSHVRGELAVSVLSILALAVIFRLGRLPLPMLPALAAGLLRLVPFFGVPAAAGTAFVAGCTVSVAAGAVTAAVTVVVMIAAEQIVARRLLAARRPSPTLTVLLVVALVDAYGVIGLVFASPLAMAIEACIARLLVTHPQAVPHEQTLAELRARIEGTRRRLLLVPEPGATQLADMVSRLGALAAEVEGASSRPSSQLS
jgi:predicted PurR-regulated permease PerM